MSRIRSITLAVALTLPAAAGLAQTDWISSNSADFNNPTNWNGTYIDDSSDSSPNPNCTDDNGSNSVVLIQPGDPIWYHGDTLAGNAADTSGAYLQTGSTNNTGYPNNGNWVRLGIGSGSEGYYVLSNGVVNVAGQTHMGENGYGYLEVDGGVYNAGISQNPGIVAGDGDFGNGGSGELVLNGGTINNANNETWFGEQNGANSGTGYFMMSGGTFNANNWFVFGRNGATGYGTMTGGTINFTGGGNFLIGGGGIGSLAQSGGTINAHNAYLIPQSNGGGSGAGTNILSGTAVLNVYSWLAVGRGGYGEMDISGNASVTHNDGGSHFDIGAGGSSASGAGVLNQNGGTITEATSDFWLGEVYTATYNMNLGSAYLKNVVMSVNNNVASTLNLNGGLFQATGITSSTSGSVSTLNLNGGTLQANANNAAFINGLFQAFVGGSATIDSQDYNITIPQTLQDNGGGSLTKVGSGTLTLTGANSYAGSTTVNAGTLATTTATVGGGAYSVANGATLNVQVVGALNNFIPMASLTLSGPATTLGVNLGSFGTPTSAPIEVAGALTANGTVTVNVTASELPIATIPLISYANLAGTQTFVLGNLPVGVVAHLAASATTLNLVVTSSAEPRWNGNVTGDWDLGTNQDWFDLISMMPIAYSNGKPVIFDDNATGTTTVNLTGAVSPGSINFNNNVLSYTITGTGSINGTTGLNVNGTNSVTISNTGGNVFTGPVLVGGGTLNITSLANGGSASAIGASSANPTNLLLGGGTLNYSGPAVSINRGYTAQNTNGTVDINAAANLTFSGQVIDVPGSGFIKSGPAQLTYAMAGINALSDTLGYGVAEGSVLFAGSVGGQTNSIAGNLVVDGPNGGFYSAPLFTSASLTVTNNAVLNVAGGFDIGDSGSGSLLCTGLVNQAGGSISVLGQTFVGQATNGNSVYNLSGGTLNVYNWLAIGRDGGTGTLNLSGTGVLHDWGGGGGNIDIGTSGGFAGVAGYGTLNQTGGAITNTASEVWLGEGSSGEPTSGTWNMSGGTAQLGELHIGVGGTGTSTLNISGSASITESYLLLANYDTNTTADVNIGSVSQLGGTITVNADMNVGGQGTGTLNFVANGGGKLTVTGTLYLSRFSQVANGTINLNTGGTLVAGYINNGWGFQNGFTSPLDNPNALNFNGGTLKAYVGSQYFIQPYVNAVVQSGGAIIDDGGYSIDVLAPLVAGGGNGGLTKLGNGTLHLDATNTYTGTTLVSAGALGVAPNGVITGPVTVASGATLDGNIGSIGSPFSIKNTLTLASGSSTFIQITPSSNDQIIGLTSVNYGGALVVTNVSSSPLTVGKQYLLFNAAGAGTGNFSSITILSSTGSYSGTFNPATGILTIAAGQPLTLNSPTVSAGNLVLTGSGGSPSGTYSVLSSTNLTIPISQWITNTTGVFSGGGTFSNAIPINHSTPEQFFDLKTP